MKGKKPKLSEVGESHVLISNHTGWAEIAFITMAFRPSFVAKKGISKWPIIGAMTRAMNCIYVDRMKNKGSKVKSTTDEITQKLNEEGTITNLAMFPEGTTSNGTHLVHFRHGAFVPGKPIVPIVFRFPIWFKDPSSSSFPIMHSFMLHMCMPFSSMVVEYLDVYRPSEEEKLDADLYSLNVKRFILSKSHLKHSDYQYADKLRYEAEVGYENGEVRRKKKRRDTMTRRKTPAGAKIQDVETAPIDNEIQEEEKEEKLMRSHLSFHG